MASSMLETKTLPSPILPVLAALTMAVTAASTRSSGRTISSLIFGQEIDGVFAAAINFGVAFLAAEAFDFGDGHAFDADFAERVFDFLQFERFDDRFDFFHSFSKWNSSVAPV